MGRPREHDLDAVLDHARRLWVEGGAAAVTIRALSSASGVSNGAIYHAFGSRDGLRARVWVREARRFLDQQRAGVAEALDRGGTPADAVVSAALAPADYARTDEPGARLLLSVRVGEVAGGDLSEDQRAELAGLRDALDELIRELADRVWGRSGSDERLLVRYCLVELPSALLLSPARTGRGHRPLARWALERAVRALLEDRPHPG